MFTGIVQGVATVSSIKKEVNITRIELQFPANLIHDLVLGASVAVNGCCLTVTCVKSNKVCFDVIQKTLEVTNLCYLNQKDRVNIERSLKFNQEIGGHLLSGHIICIGRICEVICYENLLTLRISPNDGNIMHYIFEKGYIAIDGISLTVSSLDKCSFSVNLIPETLRVTNIKGKKEGSLVNIEIDYQTQVIVKTVNRLLPEIIKK